MCIEELQQNLIKLEADINYISANLIINTDQLKALKIDWLGKEGKIKKAFSKLKSLSSQDKQLYALKLNTLKDRIEIFFEKFESDLQVNNLKLRLKEERLDITLSIKNDSKGGYHPLTIVERKIEKVLSYYGIKTVKGPELETEYYCFDALNIPKNHPARDMQDTFYTDSGHVLRTHTSSVQCRVLEKGFKSIKIGVPGRAYRNETVDASHTEMFHQYEVLWVEKGASLAQLMGLLTQVLKSLYGKRRKIRFVPKFYPYTEPSIGALVNTTGEDNWITVAGAGMVHRNVLTEFGYDPEKITGFAFGLGTSRLVGEWFGFPDVRTVYENDLRVLRDLL
jgi:phenylalanyl-tRNA synthetase alpha chain